MPWRSPGTAGLGNPGFSRVVSTAEANHRFQIHQLVASHSSKNGTDLPPTVTTTWKAGSIVNVEWAIYANHGGGKFFLSSIFI